MAAANSDSDGHDQAMRVFRMRLPAIQRATGHPPMFFLDKDGTLTHPRKALGASMAAAVHALGATGATIAVISGAESARLRKEVFEPLRAYGAVGGRLLLISENGAQVHVVNGDALDLVGASDLRTMIGAERFAQVLAIVEETRVKFHIANDPYRRNVVINDTQIKLSGLGNAEDEALRKNFDPDGAQRTLWAQHVRTRLVEEGLTDAQGPIVDVIVAGASSINILARGVHKGSAIQPLLSDAGLDARSAVYFGDSFAPGGNDALALPAVGTAVNFGADVVAGGGAPLLINATQKGPAGVELYLRLAASTLQRS